MTEEAYESIIQKLRVLEECVRHEAGCYIQECVSEVKAAVVEAKREEENSKCS